MRQFISAFLVASSLMFVVGCETTLREQSIPLPAATPFDSNAAARQVYLDAFRDGYRWVMYNGSTTVDSIHGPNQRVQEMGWRAGAAEANREKGEKK